LIETMVAMAAVGMVGVAVSTLLTVANRESRETRAANVAATEAQLVMERMIGIAGGAKLHGGVARFCEAIAATGGPLAGGSVSGACPNMVVTGVPIAGVPTYTVDATMAPTTIGTSNGYRLDITIKSPATTPVKISTLLGSF
jgi:type II secretory pathway pseudopilin PulG